MDKPNKYSDLAYQISMMWGKPSYDRNVFQSLLDRISYLEITLEHLEQELSNMRVVNKTNKINRDELVSDLIKLGKEIEVDECFTPHKVETITTDRTVVIKEENEITGYVLTKDNK